MAQSLMNRVPVSTGLVTPAAGFGSGSMFAPLTEEEERARNKAAFAERMSGLLGSYKPGNSVYDFMQNIGDNIVSGQFAKDVYQGSPLAQTIGENYGVALQSGVPQVVKKDAQVTEEKLAVPISAPITSPKRKRVPIRVASEGPRRVRGLGTGKTSYGPDGRLITAGEAYKPASQSGRQLTGPMAQNPLVPVRPPIEEEEEDNPYNREFVAKALAKAYAASIGGKPPTPYAQGVGTLRNFTALPFV